MHFPFLQIPLFEHFSSEHVFISQFSPSKPLKHEHISFSHIPFPLQLEPSHGFSLPLNREKYYILLSFSRKIYFENINTKWI